MLDIESMYPDRVVTLAQLKGILDELTVNVIYSFVKWSVVFD
ncbi:hypothetical protein VCR15J2_470509 [Vibrio coralliirubri]|nr:hypothetical protein VCR15J2_470509 [Vibrio coralliirubri]